MLPCRTGADQPSTLDLLPPTPDLSPRGCGPLFAFLPLGFSAGEGWAAEWNKDDQKGRKISSKSEKEPRRRENQERPSTLQEGHGAVQMPNHVTASAGTATSVPAPRWEKESVW